MELTKPLNERTQQLRALAPVLFLSIIFSLIMLGIFWDRVSSLDLWDDDDYMRLVQISGWVTSGNWYLQPLERLNPQDGQIIHWSRVPDILPYVLIKILSAVTDSETATLVSISITPLIYLCVTVVCISAVTNKLFGAQYAFVSAAYALSSYLLVKFLPGSIDHHNVQLFITALFILLIPNTEQGFKDEKKAWTQGMLAALSLWVGVANILFFITALTVLVLYGIFKREVSLKYASTISLSAFILSLLFILLNRPYSEFFDIHIDAISIPFSFCFLSGFIFCRTYIKLSNKLHLKPLLILVCSIISLSPTLIIFPQLLTDFAYSGYPEVLRFYWLDLVSETFSTLHYINKEGFFSSSNIILMFAPAILAILAIDKKKPIFNFYAIFLFSLAIPFFWQARASMVPVLLAIPLQAFVAVTLSKKVKSNLYKALIILALSPIFIGSILDTVKATGNKEVSRATEISLTQETEKHKNLNHLLKEVDFGENKVLAPVDFGTRILALTEASVISVPYHRNISGNSFVIKQFLNTDLDQVHNELISNNIHYVIVGNSQQSKAFKLHSEKKSFFNQLDNNQLPNWLIEIYRKNGTAVFQLTAPTEGKEYE